MSNREDLFNKVREITNKVKNIGGTINTPTLNAISSSLDNIPKITITTGSYTITTADLPDTTIVLSQNGTTIDTQTTPATTGGVVMFTLSSSGTYILTATRNSTQVWTKEVVVGSVGNIIVKQPILLDNFTAEEIDLACKNHYAKYMWEIGDYKDFSSFMGSTSTYSVTWSDGSHSIPYRRAFLIDFESNELADNSGMCGAKFAFARTPSTYKHLTTSITNARQTSWIGSEIREKMLSNGTDYYKYEYVTSSTTGDYYIYNNETNDFESVSLPSGYMNGQIYYTKVATASDGAILSGMPSELSSRLVEVKTKTWNGTTNSTYTATIVTKDKIFSPSVIEIAGNRMNMNNYRLNEGQTSPLAKETFCDKYFNSTTTWFRSPNTSMNTNFCTWNNSGNVSTTTITSSFQCAVCFCL